MSWSSTSCHYVRILPDGTREFWCAAAKDDPPSPSDVSYGCCPSERTTWRRMRTELPLDHPQLYYATNQLAALPPMVPCRCVVVVIEQSEEQPLPRVTRVEEVDMVDPRKSRPFTLGVGAFSWTVGLDWELPIVAVEEGDVVVVRDRATGTKIATAKPGTTIEQAIREMRCIRY